MPAPEQEIILTPASARISVGLEPAHNATHSLLLLAKSGGHAGMSDWIPETLSSMSPSERDLHRLVMIGFHYIVKPYQPWPSFTAFLNHLDQISPLLLRDKLLDAYIRMPCIDESETVTIVNEEEILTSVESFLAFLHSRFDEKHVDIDLEAQAYSLIIDPPAMKRQIVTHLRYLWEKYLAGEWARVKPMLHDSVAAFEVVDFDPMTNLEAAQYVTGQSLDSKHWAKMLKKAERIVFVPSAHVGPYLGQFWFGNTLGIIFGARLPEGSQYHAPDLSRAEILVRLGALADDTRLRILKFIVDHGEQRSQEIIQELNLSQSAASRHLTQLNATGYLSARRCEGAKCYQVNSSRVQDTLNAVQAFLKI